MSIEDRKENYNGVSVGAVVVDTGCELSRRLGMAPIAGRVVKIFPWGLRLCDIDDPRHEWDCQHWRES